MQYFLWTDGAEHGPYDEAAVRAAIDEGQLSPTTLARHVSRKGWKELIEFFPPPKKQSMKIQSGVSSLFFLIGGHEYGPLSPLDIERAYFEKRLTTQTPTRRNQKEEWRFLSKFIEFPNFHLPFCSHCGDYVQPQVVAKTSGGGSARLMLPAGEGYVISPASPTSTHFLKFCSHCGERVFSQADLDTLAEDDFKKKLRREESAKALASVLCISGIIGFGFVSTAVLNKSFNGTYGTAVTFFLVTATALFLWLKFMLKAHPKPIKRDLPKSLKNDRI